MPKSFSDRAGQDSGPWAVVEIGMMITLSRDGEDENGGLCTTCRLVKVAREEMERF